MEKGCDRLVIVLTRERSYLRTPDALLPVIRTYYRKYPKFVETMEHRAETYNSNRQELFEAEKQGKVLLFAPESTKGFSRTEHDVKKIQALWQTGLDQSRARADEVKSYLNKA